KSDAEPANQRGEAGGMSSQCERMYKLWLLMSKKVHFLSEFLFFCSMKLNLLPLISGLLFTSCISEYEERLEKARELVVEIEEVKNSQDVLGYNCEPEIAELKKEI